MTPPPLDGDTPREAADRLFDLCDELERRQVPVDQVEGVASPVRSLPAPYGRPVRILGTA